MSLFDIDELMMHLENGKTIIYNEFQIKPTEENKNRLFEMTEILHPSQITDQMILESVGEAV